MVLKIFHILIKLVTPLTKTRINKRFVIPINEPVNNVINEKIGVNKSSKPIGSKINPVVAKVHKPFKNKIIASIIAKSLFNEKIIVKKIIKTQKISKNPRNLIILVSFLTNK